jgi:hypothetical protein
VARGKPNNPANDPARIKIIGNVSDEDLPIEARTRSLGERRWETLGAEIVKSSRAGLWLKVELDKDADPDVIRAGVATELKRYDVKSTTRMLRNDDGTTTVYFKALPQKEAQNNTVTSN